MDQPRRVAAVTPRPLVVRLGERELTVVTGADGHVVVNGIALRVEAAGPGCWRVEMPSGSQLVHVAGDAAAPWAFTAGETFEAELAVTGRAARSRRREPEGVLASPMPATVRTVLVSPGQQVRKGDTVLTLEAMKMELPLRAPADGVVQAVHCRKGDLVQPGIPLVEIA